jgi:NADPH-dependent glutamate synthase beta subunit-like oxidoreductase
LNSTALDIAIIGAGPYGLSLAAHLKRTPVSFRIFGEPMRFWSRHMPRGMHLKSEGFASNLSDPGGEFTLRDFCREQGIDYADVGLPVALETFIAYGREFQRRFAPSLEPDEITALSDGPTGFELTTEKGERVHARQVVIATGIGKFTYLPAEIRQLPESLVTHSSQHSVLKSFANARVAVLGAGASALDIAALLHEAGADVQLIARTRSLKFHDKPREPRPLIERIKEPRSGLGTGWRSRLSCDLPLVFHALPESVRLRAVARHLGPAPCWFTRDAVEGKIGMHLGAMLEGAEPAASGIRLAINQMGERKMVEADHLIAATGFQVAMSRLAFLQKSLRERIRSVVDSPVLGRRFEASVPGLYFVGISAANSFGPLLRFAFGADYTARRLAGHLANEARRGA